ncbi:hypothetical protein PAMC26510_10355 [Caballeronia sordidicola]|uniref:Uncharacterized protein n=1 Tax=Caballeronia sordidicola TaxID=196367 RepID=A0A242N0X8_CABSO|nr:hypothetical protein PAMC26510_10355 [Caballeronia sordidicola]
MFQSCAVLAAHPESQAAWVNFGAALPRRFAAARFSSCE